MLRGWAGQELLDSYEAERRPVAEHNVTRSADPNGSVRTVDQELHADLGGRIRHLWLPDSSGRTSTLDLLGAGLTLFTGPPDAAPADAAALEQAAAGDLMTDAAASGTPPLTVRRLDAVTARALGVPHGGALLVRPDGEPLGSWPGASDRRVLTPALRSFVEGTVQPLPTAAPGHSAGVAA